MSKLLPSHVADAERFEQWVKDAIPLLQRLSDGAKKIAADWPDELQQPFAFYFADVANCLRILDRCFGNPGARQSNTVADIKERIVDHVDGFGAVTRQRLDELLATLRATPTAADTESEAA